MFPTNPAGLCQKSGAALSQYVYGNLVLTYWENFFKDEKIKTKKCAQKILPLLLKLDKKDFIANWNSGRSIISSHTIPGKLRRSKIQHQRELCYLISSSDKCQSDEWISGILHLSCRNYVLYLHLAPPSPCPSLYTSFLLKLLAFYGGLMVICLYGSGLELER